MVNVVKGVLVNCDQAMKQFLLHLDETRKLGNRFIIQDLDETHLFISADKKVRKSIMASSTSTSASRESSRIKEGDKRRVLDDATRRRRQRKALEALEADNYHEDPHADLVMSKKVPKFEEQTESRGRKRKTKSAEYFKMKYRKTLQQLIDEDKALHPDPPNYFSAAVGLSQLPERHFCSVCGFFSKYTCVPCGARYCSLRCLNTHLDTRCLKWTA